MLVMNARMLLGAVGTVWGLWLAADAVRADNWPQWRGPDHNGVSRETDLPTQWSRTSGVLWRVPLPGQAGSTPVVWDDHIFVTTADADSEDLLLLCFDRGGKLRWKQVVGTGNRVYRTDEGNNASPSPCTDGTYVWSLMGTGDLGCYDFQGRQVWKFNLQDRYGRFNIQFGMASTPVLHGDRLYLQLIHGAMDRNPSRGWVVALDKTTGREVWRQQRVTDAIVECKHSYASPTLYRDAQRELLLTHGADYIIAHRLDDGSEVWRCGGLNVGTYNPTFRLVASPVAVPGLIVVPSCKNGPVLGLRPDGQGDITRSQYVRWIRPSNTPDVPSPLVHDGLVYLCRENGVLICLDAQSGEEVYQESVFRDRHRASPVYADGKIYLTARRGVVSVVRAGRQFELLAQNALDEEMASSPAISNGRIYLRTFDALYAIGEK
jgi:outer membrane protein assembly factor BamB